MILAPLSLLTRRLHLRYGGNAGEAEAVFVRAQEASDHEAVIMVRLIQLLHPELEACVVRYAPYEAVKVLRDEDRGCVDGVLCSFLCGGSMMVTIAVLRSPGCVTPVKKLIRETVSRPIVIMVLLIKN